MPNVKVVRDIMHLQRLCYPNMLLERPEYLWKILSNPSTQLYTMYSGMDIMGYIIAYPIDNKCLPEINKQTAISSSNQVLFIHDMCVHPQHRKNGIASSLVNKLSISPHTRQIYLISVQNTASFWCKHGFVPDPTINAPKCYGKDAIVMTKYKGTSST